MTLSDPAEWALEAPILAVVPRDVFEHEPEPLYKAALATPVGANYLSYLHKAYWVLGPGRQPIEWRPGLKVDCPRCRRHVGMARDGGPVRHKFGGQWCATPR